MVLYAVEFLLSVTGHHCCTIYGGPIFLVHQHFPCSAIPRPRNYYSLVEKLIVLQAHTGRFQSINIAFVIQHHTLTTAEHGKRGKAGLVERGKLEESFTH